MTQVFLSYLLTGLIGTMSALIFLLIKPFTKRCFSSSWHYYAWLVVLVVMMVPLRFNVQKINLGEITQMEELFAADTSPRQELDAVTKNENTAPIISEAAKSEEVVNRKEIAQESVLQKNVPEKKTATVMPQSETKSTSFFENCKNIFQNNINFFAQIWLWGMVLLFTCKVIKYKAFLKNILKNSEKVQLGSVQAENVEVRVMSGAQSPFVIKCLSPILVLPDKEMTDAQMQNVLAHELTHIKRHDIVYKWIVTVVKAVHWFNPFMYLIAKRIEKDCEISCDEVAVKSMNDNEKKSYADTILSFVSGFGRAMPFTTSMATGKQTLKGRLLAIKNSKRKSKRNTLISVLVALIFLVNFIAVSAFAGGTLLPINATIESTSELKIGDYITLGKYQGETILWRYVLDDENGKLFLCDKILCHKSFDSVGEVDGIEHKGSHALNGNRQIMWASWQNGEIVTYQAGGSNYWGDSNIRSWLISNEDEKSVKWLCDCPPDSEIERTEKGFLHNDNFSTSEKTLIKTVYLHNYLDRADKNLAIRGTELGLGIDYENRISALLPETMFLPGLDQIMAIQDNGEFSSYLTLADEWWIRTPYTGYTLSVKNEYSSIYSLCVKNGSSEIQYGGEWVADIGYGQSQVLKGVRPAFYLDEENVQKISGSGSKDAPYLIEGKSVPERFRENSLYGYKDNNGNVISPAKYLKAWEFSDDAALVVLPEDPAKLRYINTKGDYLFDKAFYASNNFYDGYALVLVADDPKYSYIDKKGEVATELLFDDAEDFCRGYARVQIAGKWGIIDTDFNFVVPCEYESKDKVLGELGI